jgi:hypothetical protein
MQLIEGHQVDENMRRAQRRDAALSKKFFFRKDVYFPGQNASLNASSLSGVSYPTANTSRPKERKLRNCFPPLPPPQNGSGTDSIEEEYEEMDLNDIFNGKVCSSFGNGRELKDQPLRVTYFLGSLISYTCTWTPWIWIRKSEKKLKNILT